jgi:hypothetical protein
MKLNEDHVKWTTELNEDYVKWRMVLNEDHVEERMELNEDQVECGVGTCGSNFGLCTRKFVS